MKATAPTTAFEVPLYELLVDAVPARVVHPIAVDPDAGWLLLPDGGTVLAEHHEGADLLDRLVEVARQYGQMQVDLAARVDDLLSIGVADMRPARMLERFDEAVGVAHACCDAAAADDARRGLERVEALRPVFARWCDRLAAAPGSASLDHNDLHGRNVFISGEPGAIAARFFDWGDAVVAHPFASLLVLRSVERHRLGVHGPTPTEARIVDAYLEPFTGLAPLAELRDAVDVACEVGKAARALVWARAVALLPADDPDGREDASAPLDWVLELLEGPMATEPA
jgi:Ser/Thr protein kinase RdoA (MazF antagonist)